MGKNPTKKAPHGIFSFALLAFSAVSPFQSFTLARMSLTASLCTMKPRTFSFT